MTDLLTTYAIPISTILRVIALIVSLFFVLPLQIKEAQVKNGLRLVRGQLLALGITLFIANVIGLYFLFDRYTDGLPETFNNALAQVINSIVSLIVTTICYFMYHTQYTPMNKERHRLIDSLEKGNERMQKNSVNQKKAFLKDKASKE